MAQRGRGGRPWGPIRAESEEARKLASFLRQQVDLSGKSLATLQKEMHISKTQIGVKLSGKRIDKAFVTALLHATISEPRLRERRKAEAETLLVAVARPTPQASPPGAGVKSELEQLRIQHVNTLLQLTQSLERQNQLRETVGNSTKLVFVLLGMLYKLELRITNLSTQRDQLLNDRLDPLALQRAEEQLNRACQQEQRAQEELERAKDKQRQAESLAEKIQERVDELSEELARLRANATQDDNDHSEQVGTPSTPSTDPVGDDIDQALARAASVNDDEARTLQNITDDLSEETEKDLAEEQQLVGMTEFSTADVGTKDNSNEMTSQSSLAFEAFHHTYRGAYVRWAQLNLGSRAEAEDIVDAAMLELLERWPQLLKQREPAGYAWLVVKNRIQDAATNRSRLQKMTDAIFSTVTLSEQTDPIGALETSLALWEAIDALPERQHDVVQLRFKLGYTNRETAAVLGVTETTVRATLREARRRLAQTLDFR